MNLIVPIVAHWPRHASRFCIAALLVLSLAGHPFPIHAQTSSATANTSAGGAPGCLTSTASCSWVSPDGLASADAAAHAAVGGPLGVVASVNSNGYDPGGFNVSATAWAYFTDTFVLSNVPPGGTMQFNAQLTGSAAQNGGCQILGTYYNGVVLSGPTTVGPSPCPFVTSSNVSLLIEYDYLNPGAGVTRMFLPGPLNTNYTNVSGSYNGIYSATVPVVSGSNAIRMQMFAIAHLFGPSGPFGSGASGPITGSASSDFFSTARLNSIVFFDANGVDVSNQVGFTAASGANYPIGLPTDDPNVVPEPGTMALFATGLALLGGAARRRGRSEEPLG